MKKSILIIVFSAVIPAACPAQTSTPLDVRGKLSYHAENIYDPTAVLGFAAYAGVLQAINTPEEWGQGGRAYAKRVASTAGWAGIHGALAFGLDAALHQDPRYYPSSDTGFWRRAGHAVRATILTHTDSGGETFSTWRFGSAYGSAYLSNVWYPDRLNTARLGFLQGSMGIGFDLVSNLGSEFWPDIKRKVLHRGVVRQP